MMEFVILSGEIPERYSVLLTLPYSKKADPNHAGTLILVFQPPKL